MSDYLPLPKIPTDRTKGQIYMRKNEIVIWNGERLLCEHNKRKTHCIKCGGNKLCESDGCEKWASHNFEGETMGKFCATHKLKKMINLKKDNRICEHTDCKKLAGYNFPGKNERRFCVTHKLDGMETTNKKCEYKGCKKQPHFNIEGETAGRFCAIHQLDGMDDVVNKKCEYKGCKRQPHFNIEGEKGRGRFCSTHKLDGMKDITKKHCEKEGCQIKPYYNVDGETTGRFCATHKLDGMEDITKKYCEEEGCKIKPCYNNEEEETGRFCVTHKLDGMINVVSPRCKTHLCYTQLHIHSEKYEGYCLRCFIYTFPDKPVARNYKTKEYAVEEYIKQNFPDYTWIADRQIQDGCSKKKPDLLLDLGFQILNIETDENQHKGNSYSCENKRIMQLSQDVGHRPIIFIRFNPDGYTKDGKKITSCWEYNKQGLCVLNKSKQKEWEQRLETLKNKIIYWSDESNITDKTIKTIHLFYDE